MNIRKAIIISLLAVPSISMAQSEWELPDAQKDKTEKANIKSSKPKKALDPKYTVGTVPVVDGKVEWTYTVKADGKSAEEVFNTAFNLLSDMTKEEIQTDKSRITAVNKAEHIIAAHFEEELVFSSALLARDFTEFRYTIIATAKEGELELKLCRISYDYEKKRPTAQVYSAEELITDENAMNKKRTKFYPMTGKFRCKTIDRKDAIFSNFEKEFSK